MITAAAIPSRRGAPPLKRGFFRLLSSFLIGCVIGAALVALPYLIRPGLRIDFDQDSPYRLKFTRGFYPSERTADGVTFAWTAGRASLQLRNLPRATGWRFAAKISVPRREPGTSEVTLLVDRGQRAQWTLVRGVSHELEADVPAVDRERGAQIELRVADVFVPGPDDPRELGLAVDRITIVPESRFRGLPLSVLLRFAAAVGLLGAIAAFFGGLPWAAGISVASGLAVSALTFHRSALYLDFDQYLPLAVAGALVVLAGGRVLSQLLRTASSTWTAAAIAVGIAATFVKLLVVLHPGLTLGDSVFHLNRLKLVMEGTWFFTSKAPGGDFPYPVAFYVIVSKLPTWGIDWIPLMRSTAIVVDGFVALCLALTVGRWRGDRAALFTLGTWHTLPALFQVQGIAYLTNAFGNLVAAGALTALIFVRERRWLLPLTIASACAFVAFLAHVSSFLILLGTLLLVALASLVWNRRTLAAVSLTVALIGGTAAWTAYYRHFSSVYGALYARPAGPAPAAPAPVQRAEAHQTVWAPGWMSLRNRIVAIPAYLGKYFGWPVLVLSAAGLLHTVRRSAADRDGLDIVLVAWVVTAMVFLLISLFTPLDVRYYLAAAPAVAALSGCTTARWLVSPDRRWRIAGAGLFAMVVAQGIWYVVRFFGPVLPR
jgi:hypothetical protein